MHSWSWPRLWRLAIAVPCLLAIAGCEPSEPPAPLSASEGLAYLLPTSEGGTDIALVRLSDGSARMLTATPDRTETNLLWVSSIMRLAFTSEFPGGPPGASRIFLLDPRDGARETASDRSEDKEFEVSVSPDGKRLAYRFVGGPGSRTPRGVKTLRVMTSGDTVVGAPRDGAVPRRPRISPNGIDIVVELRRPLRSSALALLAADGSFVPLVDQPRFHDTRARFSHDGSKLYFQRSVLERPKQRERRLADGRPAPLGGGDVCSVDVATKDLLCIGADESMREHAIEPSPTRDEVVFVRDRGEVSELVLADAGGEGLRVLATLTGEQVGSPVWSPDGERIAFVSGPVPDEADEAGEGLSEALEKAVLRVVDRQGQPLLEIPGFAPTWTPPLPSASRTGEARQAREGEGDGG